MKKQVVKTNPGTFFSLVLKNSDGSVIVESGNFKIDQKEYRLTESQEFSFRREPRERGLKGFIMEDPQTGEVFLLVDVSVRGERSVDVSALGHILWRVFDGRIPVNSLSAEVIHKIGVPA